jgi:hypothetical protein
LEIKYPYFKPPYAQKKKKKKKDLGLT